MGGVSGGMLDMEGLADYVDALAAADMDTWAVAN